MTREQTVTANGSKTYIFHGARGAGGKRCGCGTSVLSNDIPPPDALGPGFTCTAADGVAAETATVSSNFFPQFLQREDDGTVSGTQDTVEQLNALLLFPGDAGTGCADLRDSINDFRMAYDLVEQLENQLATLQREREQLVEDGDSTTVVDGRIAGVRNRLADAREEKADNTSALAEAVYTERDAQKARLQAAKDLREATATRDAATMVVDEALEADTDLSAAFENGYRDIDDFSEYTDFNTTAEADATGLSDDYQDGDEIPASVVSALEAEAATLLDTYEDFVDAADMYRAELGTESDANALVRTTTTTQTETQEALEKTHENLEENRGGASSVAAAVAERQKTYDDALEDQMDLQEEIGELADELEDLQDDVTSTRRAFMNALTTRNDLADDTDTTTAEQDAADVRAALALREYVLAKGRVDSKESELRTKRGDETDTVNKAVADALKDLNEARGLPVQLG